MGVKLGLSHWGQWGGGTHTDGVGE